MSVKTFGYNDVDGMPELMLKVGMTVYYKPKPYVYNERWLRADVEASVVGLRYQHWITDSGRFIESNHWTRTELVVTLELYDGERVTIPETYKVRGGVASAA